MCYQCSNSVHPRAYPLKGIFKGNGQKTNSDGLGVFLIEKREEASGAAPCLPITCLFSNSYISISAMPRRVSSSTQALLGLLTIAPMSGYDLGQNVRASVGHIWSESYGQIYPNLKRLAAAGLVVSKTENQIGRPDRRIYSITKKGRDELAEWLGTPPQPEVPRNEMLLKLFFGAQARPSILIAYVKRMVLEHRALLKRFTEVEREDIAKLRHRQEAPFWRMTARYGQLEMEAHLVWAEEALAALRALDKRHKRSSKPQKEKPNARV